MKKLIWLIAVSVWLMAIGCKTQKTKTKTEIKTEIQKQETKAEVQQENYKIQGSQTNTSFENEILNYNFSLESKDASNPAIVTEYRNGKPYRSIVAQNANYSENKSQEARTKSQEIKDYSADFSSLKTAFESQNTRIVQLQKKVEILKVENLKIANNIKYLLWFLIAFAGVWIAERSGLFSLIKTRFKRF